MSNMFVVFGQCIVMCCYVLYTVLLLLALAVSVCLLYRIAQFKVWYEKYVCGVCRTVCTQVVSHTKVSHCVCPRLTCTNTCTIIVVPSPRQVYSVLRHHIVLLHTHKLT